MDMKMQSQFDCLDLIKNTKKYSTLKRYIHPTHIDIDAGVKKMNLFSTTMSNDGKVKIYVTYFLSYDI